MGTNVIYLILLCILDPTKISQYRHDYPPHPLNRQVGPNMDSVTLRQTHFKLGDYTNPYRTSSMEQSRDIQSAGYRAVSLDQ